MNINIKTTNQVWLLLTTSGLEAESAHYQKIRKDINKQGKGAVRREVR